jgi:hypothetical protein
MATTIGVPSPGTPLPESPGINEIRLSHRHRVVGEFVLLSHSDSHCKIVWKSVRDSGV